MTVFLVPHVALMAIPMIGPLAFIPVQAAAAWLVDLIESKAGPQPLRPESQAHKAAELTPLSHTPPPGSNQQWNNPNPPGSIHKWSTPDPADAQQPLGMWQQHEEQAQHLGNRHPGNQQWGPGKVSGKPSYSSQPQYGAPEYSPNAVNALQI